VISMYPEALSPSLISSSRRLLTSGSDSRPCSSCVSRWVSSL
jgi:hypothetical protein